MKYTCPCCGYKTLDEEPPGTYDICKICFWEDDNFQFDHPDMDGGANNVSLKEAQKKFINFGVSEKDFLKNVRRPNMSDIKDQSWKPFE
ncbi:hypothetical protein SRABI96_03189 [Peribacillus sp. Bi96]|uniref:CPCC family cysteine-rich protein n=1 Tax=unclassified Peribacillus TaxID=2675266 RepID=UPI001D341F74|nr:CPCC family cysteine-rich protein [Peribacillus sp. Bi96]CAH0251467.1 hypothetical protein SRABI96_03189 [Peribacillus sp. Bi96]